MDNQEPIVQQELNDQWSYMNSYGRPMQEPNLKLSTDVIADLMKLKDELDEFEGSLRGLRNIPIIGDRGQVKGHQFVPTMLRCTFCKFKWEYNHKTNNVHCDYCRIKKDRQSNGTPIRLLNEVGVNNVMQNLRIQTIPKIFGFTYLNADQIEKIVLGFSLEVCADMYSNLDNYELSINDFQMVHSQVVEIKNAVINRSLEGFIPKILQTMVFKEERSIHDMSGGRQDQKKTIGQKVTGWM